MKEHSTPAASDGFRRVPQRLSNLSVTPALSRAIPGGTDGVLSSMEKRGRGELECPARPSETHWLHGIILKDFATVVDDFRRE